MTKTTIECPRCGALNKANAFFCADCKESLIMISFGDPKKQQVKTDPEQSGGNVAIPTEAAEISPQSSHPKLSLVQLECLSQPEFVFQLQNKKDGSVVGRQGDVDITPLNNSISISRKHARFFYQEGQWLLEHLSQSSHTYVNGIKVPAGCPQVVRDGDKITLANTSFLFREGKE